jgi:hypothetical protein
MDAEDWLMDTERKLKAVGANDEEKVRYAVHLLSGPAATWWDNEVTLQHPEKVFSWEEFKKKSIPFMCQKVWLSSRGGNLKTSSREVQQ